MTAAVVPEEACLGELKNRLARRAGVSITVRETAAIAKTTTSTIAARIAMPEKLLIAGAVPTDRKP